MLIILKIRQFYGIFLRHKKFFKKLLTLALYFAIMPRIATKAIEKQNTYCFWLCHKQW